MRFSSTVPADDRRRCLRISHVFIPLTLLLALAACHRNSSAAGGEVMYVSAAQTSLRDRISAVYNHMGTLKNGERVTVLEKQKRFVRVRTQAGQEGWVEMRSLATHETYDAFQKLAADARSIPAQGHATARAELNMHVEPGRETETLYQLAQGEKMELIKRTTAERPTAEALAAHRAAAAARAPGEAPPVPTKPAANRATPKATPHTAPQPSAALGEAPKVYDDFWLVRDKQGRVGWVLAHMVDVDIPLDVAQFAEGQRIQAAFLLNTVHDDDREVPQYLVLLNEPHDGIAWDFNQVRVFSWNLRRHRYETAYREHFIMGYLPVRIGNEDFGKEGVEPVFTFREQNQDGTISDRKFRLIGNIVRRVALPGEAQPKAATLTRPSAKTKAKPKPHHARH